MERYILGLNFSLIGDGDVGISFVITKSLAMPHSSSMVSSRKELLPLSGAMIFVGAARGHLSISWLWYPVKFTLTGLTRLYLTGKVFLNGDHT